MSAELMERLVGQHPAALRAVRWQAMPLGAEDLGHLEIETKHGQVVVIDHATGTPYANPPEPPVRSGPRQARDLTATVPAAFDGRPTITAVTLAPSAAAWVLALSTGAEVVFSLGAAAPTLTTRQR
jgi:hypothetical protein